MSWTQPICNPCFGQMHPDRTPVRVKDDDLMYCCMCGRGTGAGIYIRIDPRTVQFPRTEDT